MKEDQQPEDKRDSQKQKQELDTPGKIMVSGIPKREDFMEAELEKEFAPFGRITEVNIIRDKRTSIPRGFAFVTYENPQDSEDAIKAMEGKDLGGESAVHCEQAVIGHKKRRMMSGEGRGGKGGNKPRDGKGSERGRGRGFDRGRGKGVDRGRGRGRGLLGHGRRGDMQRGRDVFEDEMAGAYPEEENYDDYFGAEAVYRGFSVRGGRGIPPLQGVAAARRGSAGHNPVPRAVPGRKVLLPNPPVIGSLYPTQLMGSQRDEYYDDDDASGYQGGDYYRDSYAEGYDDNFAEEAEYAGERYYGGEWPTQSRGRGILVPRGRGVSEVRSQSRYQAEEYGYPGEGAPVQRSRAAAGPTPLLRRSVPTYSDEMYDEDSPRLAAVPASQYSRGRGRPLSSAIQAASPGKLLKVATAGRGRAAPVRRAALLETDPYEDFGMHERVAAKAAGPRVAALAAAEYDDVSYKRRVSSGAPRQLMAGRPRAALLDIDDVYGAERKQPKGSLMGDAATARRAALGAASRFTDDYQGLESQVYGEGRRPGGRRGDNEYRLREDPYRRVAAETDAYVSYPSNSRAAVETLTSDPYSRKRAIDPYEDTSDVGIRPVPLMRLDYDDFRPSAAVPAKKERIDRGGDRSLYDTYSRQEGAYRGL